MTSQLTRRGILLLSGTGVLAAKSLWKARETDFWNTKDPSQWSSEEVERLITRSPWAKQVKVSVPLPAEDMSKRPNVPGVGSGPGLGRTGATGIPGISIPGLGGRSGQSRGSGQEQFELIVRWESAKPVMEALKMPLAGMFAGHYVIGVSGIPNAHATASTLPGAFLEGKGLHPIKAEVSQKAPGSFTQSFLFGFSIDSLHLSLDDRELSFTTRIERSQINVKFNIKEMVYRGALAV